MNPYIDLRTYDEIYHELVYQRNEVIRSLREHDLLNRDRFVSNQDSDELTLHKTAFPLRHTFREAIIEILNRLYYHDAEEALYDFSCAELGGWTGTEANWLERELQQLQLIIGKLEVRYSLTYHLLFDYKAGTLTLNTNKVFSSGPKTLRTRLLTALFSERRKEWNNENIEQYFIDHFDYREGELSDKTIEKAARDINTDVAAKTGVQAFLKISSASVQVNPAFLT